MAGAESDAHGDLARHASVAGLASEQDGFRLAAVDAPGTIDTEGSLSLVIAGPDGDPVTDFVPGHGKELHLIVVRADGQHFRHVHPGRGAGGTWSIPWEWGAAGTYRVYADFVPARTGVGMTLSTSVHTHRRDPSPPRAGRIAVASAAWGGLPMTPHNRVVS